MEQISQYVSGERDYTKIRGGTGPLVYPAGHVYIYTALYYLTNQGKNILLAQQLFAGLYLVTLAAVMECYRKARVRTERFPPTFRPALYGSLAGWLTEKRRRRRTFSRSWFSRNVSIASTSSAASTTALPSSSFGWPYTASSVGRGPLVRWCTAGESGSR